MQQMGGQQQKDMI